MVPEAGQGRDEEMTEEMTEMETGLMTDDKEIPLMIEEIDREATPATAKETGIEAEALTDKTEANRTGKETETGATQLHVLSWTQQNST